MKKIYILIFLFHLVIIFNNNTFAQEYEKALTELAEQEIKAWVYHDIVINTLIEQNNAHKRLTISDFKVLESKWVRELRQSRKKFIGKILNNELSNYLKFIKDRSEDLYTSILITDKFALNAGISNISKNYWQGETEAWDKTFKYKNFATFVGKMYFNELLETFEVPVAFMLVHDDEPIGMILVTIDVEQL